MTNDIAKASVRSAPLLSREFMAVTHNNTLLSKWIIITVLILNGTTTESMPNSTAIMDLRTTPDTETTNDLLAKLATEPENMTESKVTLPRGKQTYSKVEIIMIARQMSPYTKVRKMDAILTPNSLDLRSYR